VDVLIISPPRNQYRFNQRTNAKYRKHAVDLRRIPS
jgi:hypothetical protein